MLSAEAFVLAFAVSAFAYIGLLMYEGYKEAAERNEE